MKFVHTLAAARGVEERSWAVADGLVQDFKESGVTAPTPAHFDEAADAVETAGSSYSPKTLKDYWRAASVFGTSRRRKTASVKLYVEIVTPLWSRMDEKTRANDLVSYATEFFRFEQAPSALKARAWAKKQGAALDAERRAREEAEQKKKLKEKLAEDTKAMKAAIKAGEMDEARALLVVVNESRRRLGMDLLKLDEEETTTEKDEEATEEAKAEVDEKQLHQQAKSEIEAAIANIGVRIAFLANTFLRVQEHLSEEDLDAYTEEIELEEGRLALVRAQFSGTASDDALAAALAQWESER